LSFIDLFAVIFLLRVSMWMLLYLLLLSLLRLWRSMNRVAQDNPVHQMHRLWMWMLLLLTMMQHPPFLSMAAPPIAV
jgi:hypothetical protein